MFKDAETAAFIRRRLELHPSASKYAANFEAWMATYKRKGRGGTVGSSGAQPPQPPPPPQPEKGPETPKNRKSPRSRKRKASS